MSRPAVSPRTIPGPVAVSAPPQVQVRPAGRDGGPAAVAPGDTASFEVLVSGSPGSWRLGATGLPDGWATFTPDLVRLTRRARPVRARLDVKVPATAAAPAGRRSFEVVAVGIRDPRGARGHAGAALDIAPAPLLELALPAPLVTGRRRAGCEVVVTNAGAAPTSAHVLVTDERGVIETTVEPAVVRLAAGACEIVRIRVRPRSRRLVGRSSEHELAVMAVEPGGRRTDGRALTFVQRPLLGPVSVAVLLGLLGGGIATTLIALEPRQVTVPEVAGARNVASAERAATAAGLALDPTVRGRETDAATPGTVLDQIPAPGARVEPGERVRVVVALGPGSTLVPRLIGLRPEGLARTLEGAPLSLAAPQHARGAAAEIVTGQLPLPGQRVAEGTPVTAFFGPEPGTPMVGAAVPVPDVAGRGALSAMRAVTDSGLAARAVRTVSTAPEDRVLGTRPVAGSVLVRGAPVVVRVSAGMPRLAFDSGAAVRVVDPVAGRTVRTADPDGAQATEPSWSADGRRLVYRAGRRLVSVQADAPDRGRTIYAGKARYVNATMSPARDRSVLALVRRKDGDGDLCFARLADTRISPACLPDDGWDLGRQVSWRRDGRSLLVFGVRRGHQERFGILRFDSDRPFATAPGAWRGRLVTDASTPRRGVIAAAWSPSGERVALASNVDTPRFQLVVTTAATLFNPVNEPLPVRACEVAWRPDGEELAVVRSDDTCSSSLGDVARLAVGSPRRAVTVATSGRHPVYQPLSYGGTTTAP